MGVKTEKNMVMDKASS